MTGFESFRGAAAGTRAGKTLGAGDRLPGYDWVGPDGAPFSLIDDRHAGTVTALLVCAATETPGLDRHAAQLGELHEDFVSLGVQIFLITVGPVAANRTLASRLKLPFPVICDASFTFGNALGLGQPELAVEAKAATPWRMLVLDESRRIERVIETLSGQDLGHMALAYCRERAEARTATVVTHQAPVLIVPQVIDRGHCARLIEYWGRGERYLGGAANVKAGKHVVNKEIKIRQDVVLPDLEEEAQELFALFRRRLFPEIRRVFKFHVSRAETLRLGCYDARDGGSFRPHRDDSSPQVSHRRFAVSLFLNTGRYEGGHLHFPEYGPQLYSPEAGSAIVFSCSILHGVTPVISGRRFVLLGFFHGEAEEARRRSRNADSEYTMVDFPAKL